MLAKRSGVNARRAAPASEVAAPSRERLRAERSECVRFDVETSLPGGHSASPDSRFYINLPEEWLTNETHPLRQEPYELIGDTASIEIILPRRKH